MLNGFGDAAAIETERRRLASDHGVEVRYDAANMTRPGEIARMMERAIAEFGAVDILVNNARTEEDAESAT